VVPLGCFRGALGSGGRRPAIKLQNAAQAAQAAHDRLVQGQAAHGQAGHGPAGHGQAGHGQAGHGPGCMTNGWTKRTGSKKVTWEPEVLHSSAYPTRATLSVPNWWFGPASELGRKRRPGSGKWCTAALIRPKPP
jgi:hypothetical protein